MVGGAFSDPCVVVTTRILSRWIQARHGTPAADFPGDEVLHLFFGDREPRDLVDHRTGNDDDSLVVSHDDVARNHRDATAGDGELDVLRVMTHDDRRCRPAPMIGG
jgi:hypothetical protein